GDGRHRSSEARSADFGHRNGPTGPRTEGGGDSDGGQEGDPQGPHGGQGGEERRQEAGGSRLAEEDEEAAQAVEVPAAPTQEIFPFAGPEPETPSGPATAFQGGVRRCLRRRRT